MNLKDLYKLLNMTGILFGITASAAGMILLLGSPTAAQEGAISCCSGKAFCVGPPCPDRRPDQSRPTYRVFQPNSIFNRPPSNSIFNRPPSNSIFNRPPSNSIFNRPPSNSIPRNNIPCWETNSCEARPYLWD